MRWRGRNGWVLLGPTEHRVATYLASMTRHGRVTLRTTSIIEACHLTRSEGYRITRQLRTLGLFGVENDRGGNHGGRRIWRTATPEGESRLDPVRHRLAWSRLVGAARAFRDRILARVRAANPGRARPGAGVRGPSAIRPVATGPAGRSLLSYLWRDAPNLAREWRLPPIGGTEQ